MVALAKDGDANAIEALLSRHQDAAYTAAVRLLAEPADAEDVAQETLVRAYTRIAELDDHASFGAWVKRIAINLSLNVLRRRGAIRFESLETPGGERATGAVRDFADERDVLPDQAAVNAELRDALETLVRRLPAEQRVAVVLRDMYGFDVAEVARFQRCGLSAAKMRIVRGRSELRRLLQQSTGSEALPT